MDNNSSPNQLPATDTPAGGEPNSVPRVPTGGMKVLKPTSDTLSAESPLPQTVPPPAANQAPAPASVATSPPVAPSSIYPEATHGINAPSHPTPVPDGSKDPAAVAELLNFREGWMLGGTIFWYQLMAVIVLGLIFYGVTSSLKTASILVIDLVGLLHYIFEYLILIYIPYSVLKSNTIEEPLWRSLFGAAVQSAIDAATLFIATAAVIFFFAHAITVGFITSSSGHTGTSGFTVADLVFFVIVLTIAYFCTKLSWGAAFWLIGKIKNKLIIRVIGLIIIAITIGGIIRHYMALYDYSHLLDNYKAQQIRTLQQRLSAAKPAG